MQVLKSIVLSAVVVCFMAIAVNAQEPPPFKKDVSQGQSQSEGITTGCVIAYGEILEPPYFVVYEDGVVTINDIPFVPKKKDPNKETPNIVPTEESMNRHALSQALWKYYKENKSQFGRQRAMEKVVEEFSNHEMIDDIRVGFPDIEYKLKGDPDYQIMRISASEIPPLSTEKKDEQIREYADKIKLLLNSGYMVTFGYKYESHFTEKTSKEIINVINSLKTGKINTQSGETLIYEITKGKYLANDVINNL
ncbi:MAG: hypothetical protein GY855_17000 [candidate division Zixibacteria bacterium]|nr:hypothetical protein [candidate division Zixibacteria bacterium]